MYLRGFKQIKMVYNLIKNLRHKEKYTKTQIAKASGDKQNFYRSHILLKLLLEGFFVEKSRKYEFDRKKLFDWYEKEFNIKVPLVW